MTSTSRRTVLTALGAATVGGPLLAGVAATPAHATGDLDLYTSNTDLYTKLAGKEGTDFARRYKRHEYADHALDQRYSYNRTTVLALHGGGIETGTSELCLAIAGYHPATLAPLQDGHGPHDYWLFEGLRSSDNRELHVTAKNCDDHVAVSMAAGSLNVLSLHGCTAEQAGTAIPQAVVIGGLNTQFKSCLKSEFTKAGIVWRDGSEVPDLAGVNTDNPCNRTMLAKGGQLELTTELRAAMFTVNTRAGRAGSTTPVFDRFVGACRAAIAKLETGPDQTIL
ncbi:poly-gamma-glutamate hydrolase family protein [Streptomyces sp. NPDC002889]|uniref:poly-gamma-glutamate hydrolase family protein n=1 Tax=Streptomyces sp. NPDC002889 TaxID=3364669 RepID=UPI003692B332